jgi:hypothetical protein
MGISKSNMDYFKHMHWNLEIWKESGKDVHHEVRSRGESAYC